MNNNNNLNNNNLSNNSNNNTNDNSSNLSPPDIRASITQQLLSQMERSKSRMGLYFFLYLINYLLLFII